MAAVVQADGDLGERMRAAFEYLLADREAAVLVGTDMPFLSVDHLGDALVRLRASGGVVLGPADDGGYYLIGMTETHRGLFEGIEWGASSVLTDTLRRADGVGVDLSLIHI